MEKCEERSAANAVTLQTFTQGQYASNTAYFYTRDHLGSIREMFKSDGTVVARSDYDPWGRFTAVQNTVKPNFNYTGLYRHTKSGLDFASYRAYDPTLGRWLNRDPIGEAGGLNLYGYVGNDTINATDPLGLLIISAWPNANTLSLQMYHDATAIRLQGHQTFPGEANSSARHQWAAQELAGRYDTMNARMYGALNEIQGFLWHDLWKLPSRIEGDSPWAFQLQDLMDNEIGFGRADCDRMKNEPQQQRLPRPRSSRPWWQRLFASILS